jgi:hypothetical protein
MLTLKTKEESGLWGSSVRKFILAAASLPRKRSCTQNYGREDILPKRIKVETMKEIDELQAARRRIGELAAALAFTIGVLPLRANQTGRRLCRVSQRRSIRPLAFPPE